MPRFSFRNVRPKKFADARAGYGALPLNRKIQEKRKQDRRVRPDPRLANFDRAAAQRAQPDRAGHATSPNTCSPPFVRGIAAQLRNAASLERHSTGSSP